MVRRGRVPQTLLCVGVGTRCSLLAWSSAGQPLGPPGVGGGKRAWQPAFPQDGFTKGALGKLLGVMKTVSVRVEHD